MFDANSLEFKRTAMDLANQISVFRRVIAGRNQSLLNEEERFQNQIQNATGDTNNIIAIHYRYVADEKNHIYHEVKNELLYVNILSDTYNKSRSRLVDLAKEIKNIEDLDKKKAIKDEIKVLLAFVDMYEAYIKELKSIESALKDYENHNDRYLDYIKSNPDLLKDANKDAAKTKETLKEKKVIFDINISDTKLSIMASYDNIKLENPEEFNLDMLTPEDIDFFIINFIEEIARQRKINPEEFKDKEFDVTINGNKIKNVTYDTFTNTVLAYALNQKKDKKTKEEEKKQEERKINQQVPDKPTEKQKQNKEYDYRDGYAVNEEGEIITLDSIMSKLTKDLDIAKGDDWKLTASNIRVNDAFKRKVCTGNKIYNIVALAPAVISYPFQLVHKLVGKIAYNKKIDKRINIIKERLNNLTEEELMIIYRQYKGGNLRNYQKMPVVNTLIQAKIVSWLKQKQKRITADMVAIYNTILSDFKRMSEISKEIRNNRMSEEEYQAKSDEYYALAYGKADLIREYLELSNKKLDLEIGGAKGFEESIRAYKTGMSQAGFRFRKIPKESDELNEAQAKAYEEEIKGVATGDDFLALSGFIKREKLLQENSEIEEGLLMDRDVGLRSANPIMKPLNYTQDPFVSDLMRTVVLVASGINMYTTITRVNELENLKELTNTQNQMLHDQQAVIEKLNTDLDHAQQLSQDIQSKSGAVIDSRIAQINEANLAHTNTLERAVLDQTNWHSSGAEYRALDDAAHATYNNAYQLSQSSINEIADKVSNGSLSHADAMAKLTELSQDMENQFVTNYKEVYDFVTQYAKDHPQFDLTAPTEGLEKVINTSANIHAGNQAVDEAFKLANEISNIDGISLAEFHALAENLSKIESATGVVPSQSMVPGLFNSLSAAIFALGIKNRMKKYNSYSYMDRIIDASDITDEEIKDYEINAGLREENEVIEEPESNDYDQNPVEGYDDYSDEYIEEPEEEKGRTL